VILLLLTAFMGASLQAGVSFNKSLFERGRTRLSLTAGSGYSSNNNYLVMGLGAGYYIANGFELGLDGEAWVGATPRIYQVSPGIRYVYTKSERFFPYAGAFFKRTLYEDFPDLDSVGGRAGVYSPLGSRGYAGVGAIYESWLDCDESIYGTCSDMRPEFFIGVSF
jgi:hypothetical protein